MQDNCETIKISDENGKLSFGVETQSLLTLPVSQALELLYTHHLGIILNCMLNDVHGHASPFVAKLIYRMPEIEAGVLD